MPALQTAAIVAPIVSAQAIFSSRRAKKGVENIDDYPIFGLMNLDLALGQFLKGLRAVKAATATIESGAAESIKNLNTTSKSVNGAKNILKPFGSVIRYTADHINPIIWATATVKGLGSKDEDKPTALVRELLPVGTMRLCEQGSSALIGMPKISIDNITGNSEYVSRNGAYKNLFKEEQLKAMNDLKLFNKLSVKNIAGAGKGIVFVLTSIGGYKLGTILADKLLGEKPAMVPTTT